MTDLPEDAVAISAARERRGREFDVPRAALTPTTTRTDFLRGARIDPKPIAGKETSPI